MGLQFAVNVGRLALSQTANGLTRIPLAIAGTWAKGAQKFRITAADLAAAVENFYKRLLSELVIDYEHASEYPEMSGGGPVPAAGWLKGMEREPDANGILWGFAQFTERARELIKAAEYKYLSPTLQWGSRDPKGNVLAGMAITSMALTNRPVLQSMPAIALSERAGARQGSGGPLIWAPGWEAESGAAQAIALSAAAGAPGNDGGTDVETIFDSVEKLDAYFCKLAHERESREGVPFSQGAESGLEREPGAGAATRRAVPGA